MFKVESVFSGISGADRIIIRRVRTNEYVCEVAGADGKTNQENAKLIIDAINFKPYKTMDPEIHSGFLKVTLAILKELYSLHDPKGRFEPFHHKDVLDRVRTVISKGEELLNV